MIAPLFLTSALFACKFLVENVPAANAIADGVGSFDSVRRSPHSAQDDSYFQRQDHSQLVERRASPPAWTGETPVPPSPIRNTSSTIVGSKATCWRICVIVRDSRHRS